MTTEVIADLAQGMSLCEFARSVEPALWDSWNASKDCYVNASGGAWRATATTATQQRYLKECISTHRELVQSAKEHLQTQPYLVSAIMRGGASRVQMEIPMVVSLEWDLRLERFWSIFGATFEFVRIQPLRSKRGSKLSYDWPRLTKQLQEYVARNTFGSFAELVRWCRTNIVLIETGKRPDKLPDDNTVRPMIIKYGLEKIAKVSPPIPRGKRTRNK